MKALQMIHTFGYIYISDSQRNKFCSQWNAFHIIILFHDLILKNYTDARNCKTTEEYLGKNTSYLNVLFFPTIQFKNKKLI